MLVLGEKNAIYFYLWGGWCHWLGRPSTLERRRHLRTGLGRASPLRASGGGGAPWWGEPSGRTKESQQLPLTFKLLIVLLSAHWAGHYSIVDKHKPSLHIDSQSGWQGLSFKTAENLLYLIRSRLIQDQFLPYVIIMFVFFLPGYWQSIRYTIYASDSSP